MTVVQALVVVSSMDLLSILGLPIVVALQTSLGTELTERQIRSEVVRQDAFKHIAMLKLGVSVVALLVFPFSATAALVMAALGYAAFCVALILQTWQAEQRLRA